MRCSIVIPTYNRKESLRRTLDALSRQTVDRREFEVIAVSDGSADGTAEMLAEYAAGSSLQLRPFQQENAGPAAARNRGVAEARGEVVVFIDDDVEPVPACLERHLAHHERERRVVVLGLLSPNPEFARSEPPWIAWEHAKLQSIYAMFSRGGAYCGVGAGPEHFYSGNASVRREWLEQVGGFDTRFKRQEDVELASRLALRCGVRFVWEFAADSLHHPVRTLKSWLAIPAAYGGLDAERVLSGAMAAADVEKNVTQRHPLTRALAAVAINAPTFAPALAALLCGFSWLFDRLGLRGQSLAALSAVYNMRYAAAYRKAIGKGEALPPTERRLAA